MGIPVAWKLGSFSTQTDYYSYNMYCIYTHFEGSALGTMDCRGVLWVELVGVAVAGLSRELSHAGCGGWNEVRREWPWVWRWLNEKNEGVVRGEGCAHGEGVRVGISGR